MYKLLILFILLCTSVYASTSVTIDDTTQSYKEFQLSYLKNSERSLDIEDILNHRFEKTTRSQFSLGYTKGDVWFELKVKNRSKEEDFILSLGESFYEKANLFYKNEQNNIIKKQNGLFIPLEQREIKTNQLGFKVRIPSGSTKTIYIQIQGKYAYFGDITISKESSIFKQNIANINSLYLIIFGVIFIIIVFNLFLYLKFKEHVYIYYVGYALSNLIYYINISGLLVYFDLQEYIYKLHLSAGFMLGFLVLFTKEILDVKQYLPRINRLLPYIAIAFFFFGIMVVFSYEPWNKFINNGAGILTLSLIVISTIIYFKGHSKSKYYIFAIVFYFLFVMLFTSMVAGVVEYSYLTRYGFIVVAAIETIIFSLMLSDRYNELKEETIKSQNKLIELKDENEKVLEIKIKDRTQEIEQNYLDIQSLLKEKELLLKELHHRVKNNFHILSGLLWIEEQNDNYSPKTFEKLRGRIKSMSMIHEKLYNSQDISNIQIKEYIEDILHNLLASFAKRKIRVDKKLDDIRLDFESSLALGIIINEVLTNSIRHNENIESIKLTISLTKDHNNTIALILQDNGKGFDIEQIYDGIGMDLIESFTEKLPKATYNFEIVNGVKFTLRFNKKDSTDEG